MSRHELCTVVDAGYLPRAIVLHRSLVEQGAPFCLRILCLDRASADALSRLRLSHARLLQVQELERWDPSLPVVRPSRTLTEYCWTLKPSLLQHVFAAEPELDRLAYVDADHMFWADPAPAFDELGDGCALIVPQRTTSERAGRYNAGFVLFRRSDETDAILSWWRERCLEWSFAGVAGGNRRFGDQGYLEDWPTRFRDVHVLAHPGGGLAPWNADRHRLAGAGDRVTVDGAPLLFFHHQSLRIYRGLRRLHRLRLLGERYRCQPEPYPLVWSIGRWYSFDEQQRDLIWSPYVRRVSQAIDDLLDLDPAYEPRLLELGRSDLAREVLRTATPQRARGALRRATRAFGQPGGARG